MTQANRIRALLRAPTGARSAAGVASMVMAENSGGTRTPPKVVTVAAGYVLAVLGALARQGIDSPRGFSTDATHERPSWSEREKD